MLNIISNGKVKIIKAIYYKTLGGIPIFSCNDRFSYRIVHITNIGNIILIGSSILSSLTDKSIEVLATEMLIRADSRFECSNITIDRMLMKIYGPSQVVNMLGQLLGANRTDDLSKQHMQALLKRIKYAENNLTSSNDAERIDLKDILNRAGLAQILEVA
jgi:hypothetical protein